MQKLQTQNELLEAKYFQVEELEERLENCWRGQEKYSYRVEMNDCTYVDKEGLRDC